MSINTSHRASSSASYSNRSCSEEKNCESLLASLHSTTVRGIQRRATVAQLLSLWRVTLLAEIQGERYKQACHCLAQLGTPQKHRQDGSLRSSEVCLPRCLLHPIPTSLHQLLCLLDIPFGMPFSLDKAFHQHLCPHPFLVCQGNAKSLHHWVVA